MMELGVVPDALDDLDDPTAAACLFRSLGDRPAGRAWVFTLAYPSCSIS